jgi:hypothetical protein
MELEISPQIGRSTNAVLLRYSNSTTAETFSFAKHRENKFSTKANRIELRDFLENKQMVDYIK